MNRTVPTGATASVYLSMRLRPETTVTVTMNPGDKDKAFPVLELGPSLAIFPTVEQLRKIRDEITRFLVEHGAEEKPAADRQPVRILGGGES